MGRVVSPEEGGKRSILFCKPGQVPGFHLFFNDLQNIDSFLQTTLPKFFTDFGLGAVSFGIGRMRVSPVLPVIGILVAPILLGCLVISRMSCLPVFLTEPFLLTFALGTAACFLAATKPWMGIKPDRTKGALFFGGFHRRLFVTASVICKKMENTRAIRSPADRATEPRSAGGTKGAHGTGGIGDADPACG